MTNRSDQHRFAGLSFDDLAGVADTATGSDLESEEVA
jgi:hypothetical protein